MQQTTLINIIITDMNHTRTTALEQSVIYYRRVKTSFTGPTYPFLRWYKTFGWLFGSHYNPVTRQ